MSHISQLFVTWSSRGRSTYRLEVSHSGLGKHRLISGDDATVVRRKADMQAAEWDSRWTIAQIRQAQRQAQRNEREQIRQQADDLRQEAASRTEDAEAALGQLSTILAATLAVDDTVDWNRLIDRAPFREPVPAAPALRSPPVRARNPAEPKPTDPAYHLGGLERLMPSRRRAKKQQFEADHLAWQQAIAARDREHAAARVDHEAAVRRDAEQHRLNQVLWEGRRAAYLSDQSARNDAIRAREAAYLRGAPEAVEDYCDLVLSFSDYPDFFPKEHDVDYVAETRTLVIDYELPAPDALPTLREVKYVPSRGELAEQHISESQINKLYDQLLYQEMSRSPVK